MSQTQRTTKQDPDLAKGAILIAKNARELFLASKTLASCGRYGPACSLLVLSAEESWKSVDRYAAAFGLAIDPGGPKNIKGDHRYRHRIIRALVLLYDHVKTIPTDACNTEPRESGVHALLTRIVPQMMSGSFPDKDSETWRWWASANDLKNRGLYVDRTNDGWQSPRDLGESDYLTAMQFVKPFLSGATLVRFLSRNKLPPELYEVLAMDYEAIAKDMGNASAVDRMAGSGGNVARLPSA